MCEKVEFLNYSKDLEDKTVVKVSICSTDDEVKMFFLCSDNTLLFEKFSISHLNGETPIIYKDVITEISEIPESVLNELGLELEIKLKVK
jgi:hypothetical protein